MKPWLASVGAVVAGFIVTALASTAADAVMHAARIFPSAPQLMSDSLFALAAAYRALFTVAPVATSPPVWLPTGPCAMYGYWQGSVSSRDWQASSPTTP